MEIEQFKKTLDPLIQDFLDRKLKNLPSHTDKRADIFLNYLKTFLTEGKRIRPFMAFLSYKAHGGKDDKNAIELLMFLELFHAFALIHDDIMDNADTRHGIRTAHEYIKDEVKNTKVLDATHFGYSQAILLGDYMLACCFEILNNNKPFDRKILQNVELIFSKMIDEVLLGQMIDLDTTLENNTPRQHILDKTILKTAFYSFVRPMHIGAALTGKSFNQNFFEEFGKYLGLAFQIQDDLFDIKFDEEQTHKSSFNDVEQRQQTFFTNYIFVKGSLESKQLLTKYFGKKLSKSDKKNLRKLFEDSGAMEYGEELMAENFKSAKEVLEKEKINKEYKPLFLKLIEKIEERKS